MSFNVKKNECYGSITATKLYTSKLSSCNLFVEGNVDIVNDLSVINDVGITGDLDVTGNANLQTLEVSDVVIFNDSLEVFGSCIFNDCNISSLEVEDKTFFKDNVFVSGNVKMNNLNVSELANVSELNVSGSVSISNNLDVSGVVNIVDVNIYGNLCLTNGLCVDNLRSNNNNNLLGNCYFKNSIAILENNISRLGGEISCNLSGAFFDGNDTISLEYLNFEGLSLNQGIFVNFGLYNYSKNSLISVDTHNLRLNAGVVAKNKIDFQFYSDTGITYGENGLVKEAKHLLIHFFLVSF